MFIFPPEPEITLYETGFDNDALGREKSGKSLSALLDRIEDPLVVALDGRWGTGKTYFLKRWVGAHQTQNDGKALTLYFDAFANDYLSDPLVALVSALADRIPKDDVPKLMQLKEAASKFVKPLAKIGLNIATFGATEALNDLGDAVAQAINTEAKHIIDDVWRREEGRQQAMQAFRDALSALVDGQGEDDARPLVIVIDELDRCRPDYALEVLEVIKHFFAVPMVHFVLGVNLSALENSVKARYGNGIDAGAYLQKFISMTYALPDRVGNRHQEIPTVLSYAKQTAQAMKLPKEFEEEIVDMQLPVVMRRNPVSLRDVGKIFAAVATLPPEALKPNILSGWRAIAASMIIARVIHRDVFNKMTTAEITEDELVAYFAATPDKICEQLPNGEQNPEFDRSTWCIHGLWRLVISNGAAQFDGSDFLGKMLGHFGAVRGVRNYPREIMDDWLSGFHVK